MERNNHGHGVLAHLGEREFTNIFCSARSGRMADFGSEQAGNDRKPGGDSVGRAGQSVSERATAATNAGHLFGVRMAGRELPGEVTMIA